MEDAINLLMEEWNRLYCSYNNCYSLFCEIAKLDPNGNTKPKSIEELSIYQQSQIPFLKQKVYEAEATLGIFIGFINEQLHYAKPSTISNIEIPRTCTGFPVIQCDLTKGIGDFGITVGELELMGEKELSLPIDEYSQKYLRSLQEQFKAYCDQTKADYSNTILEFYNRLLKKEEIAQYIKK